MFNRVTLMGRICHDLELKTTPTGVSVLSFKIAVDRSYQVKGEERKADFFTVVTWRQNAEFVSKYFGKGRMILIDGELQTRQYVDRNNITQNIVEITANTVHFTGEKSNQGSQGGGFNSNANSSGGFSGGYSNPSVPPQNQHPAETANTAPAAIDTGNDFSGGGGNNDEDDYPF